MRKFLLLFVLLFFSYFSLKAQEWVKKYTDGKIIDVPWVIETYDKGYLILDNENPPGFLWLIKTDINGNKLWEKRIGQGQYHMRFGNIEETIDHGFILCGASSKYDGQNDDPALIKLNSCGETDWCEVIKTPGAGDDYATRVKQTPEGDYLLLTLYSHADEDSCINLFKFNGTGNLLWKRNYFPDSLCWSPIDYDVRTDADGYLISAKCYHPDPGIVTYGWERPYFIKTDTSGNISWWLAFGVDNGFHGFTGGTTIKSNTGNYYSIGWHSNICDTPVLVKCLNDGQEAYYQDLVPGTCPGGVSDINWLNDTTLVILAGGTLNGNNTTRWMKIDTFGIQKYYKESPSWMNSTYHTAKTFDNKFVSVAKVNSYWIYLYKLNSNFDYDSVYTHQFTYDSLCPGGVISDTLNFDCNLIVSIDSHEIEEESSRLKVFPNPASGSLTVELPKYLKQTDKKTGIKTTTVLYQWKFTTLEAYDFTGKLLFSKEIPKDQQRLEIDVSGWQNGIYSFRLIYKDQTIASEKVVVLPNK